MTASWVGFTNKHNSSAGVTASEMCTWNSSIQIHPGTFTHQGKDAYLEGFDSVRPHERCKKVCVACYYAAVARPNRPRDSEVAAIYAPVRCTLVPSLCWLLKHSNMEALQVPISRSAHISLSWYLFRVHANYLLREAKHGRAKNRDKQNFHPNFNQVTGFSILPNERPCRFDSGEE